MRAERDAARVFVRHCFELANAVGLERCPPAACSRCAASAPLLPPLRRAFARSRFSASSFAAAASSLLFCRAAAALPSPAPPSLPSPSSVPPPCALPPVSSALGRRFSCSLCRRVASRARSAAAFCFSCSTLARSAFLLPPTLARSAAAFCFSAPPLRAPLPPRSTLARSSTASLSRRASSAASRTPAAAPACSAAALRSALPPGEQQCPSRAALSGCENVLGVDLTNEARVPSSERCVCRTSMRINTGPRVVEDNVGADAAAALGHLAPRIRHLAWRRRRPRTHSPKRVVALGWGARTAAAFEVLVRRGRTPADRRCSRRRRRWWSALSLPWDCVESTAWFSLHTPRSSGGRRRKRCHRPGHLFCLSPPSCQPQRPGLNTSPLPTRCRSDSCPAAPHCRRHRGECGRRPAVPPPHVGLGAHRRRRQPAMCSVLTCSTQSQSCGVTEMSHTHTHC